MVQQTGAEDGVEFPVRADVAHVVAYELQVRQLDAVGYPFAGREVVGLAFDPEHVVAGAREVNRVAALQAPKVGHPGGRGTEEAQRAEV